LLVAEAEYLGVNAFAESGYVGLAEVEIGLKEGDGPILEAWVKDGRTDLLASEVGEINRYAAPTPLSTETVIWGSLI
jgi:hypothetical protein